MVRQPFVTLIPIHFPTVRPGEKLAETVHSCLRKEGLRLRRGDILAVVSKIVSTCEQRVVKLTDLRVTSRTSRLAVRWKLDELLAAAVVQEADEIIGGVNGFLLTIKDGFLTPNAGIDLKNSPPGTATLWPSNADRSADRLRKNLEHRYHTRIGVVIVDSRVTALRLGTVGLAIGVSGFSPISDHRGVLDLFGRSIRVTQTNIGDDLAAAAHLLMGESSEHIGAVLIRGTPTRMSTTRRGQLAKMQRQKCLIGSSLVSRARDIR